jgi:hypothetical protein
MPYTSTGEASENMAWNPFSQSTGRDKVAGKEINIPPMPEGLPQLATIRDMEIADLHAAMHHMIQQLQKMAFYADPNVKFVPIQLDPQVEYIIRLDGRWHTAIWIPVAGNIIVTMPGMSGAQIPTVAGWNVLTVPEGTKLYAVGPGRLPAYMRYANRGVAA